MLTQMPTDRKTVNQQAAELLCRYQDERLSDKERQAAADAFFAQFYRLALKRIRLYTFVSRENREDIAQEAAQAVCLARDLWNPERGDFAVILEFIIRRRMQDYNRSRLMVTVGRSQYLKGLRATDITNACSVDDVCSIGKPGVTADIISFEDAINDNDNAINRIADPTDHTEDVERRVLIAQAMARLSERERAIVQCKFGFTDGIHRTDKETADTLGLGRGQCCHTLKRAKAKLRDQLQDAIG